MRLEDILRAVAQLNDEEHQQLRQYLNKTPEKASTLTAEERIQRLNRAIDAMGKGLGQAELDDITVAMTEEYIEPLDEPRFWSLRSFIGV